MNTKFIFRLAFVILLISDAVFVLAQQNITAEEYIQRYASVAVSEMERSGIPASITLAQGLLESGNGNSPLTKTANNHFGIKCHKEWTGDTYYQDDDEKNECFRYYKDPIESFIDHTDFLKTRSRYAFLFELDKTDYKSWAKGLKEAGYATNPKYPELLIGLIERYSLDKFDKEEYSASNLNSPKKLVNTEPEIRKPKSPTLPNSSSKINIKPYWNEIYLLNDVKVIFAKENDSYLEIATTYNIMLQNLLKYNEAYEGERTEPGSLIFIQPKRSKGDAENHVVLPGESLKLISQIHGIKLSELLKKNGIQPGQEVVPGEVLTLKSINSKPVKSIPLKNWMMKEESEKYNQTVETSYSLSKATSEPLTTTSDQYIVKKGDTLYSIAKACNTSVELLRDLNNQVDDNLRVGQVLKVKSIRND